MKRWIKVGLGLLSLAAASGLAAQAFAPRDGEEPERADNLVVHEWGTFLSMSGSDGLVLDGMYHEEHALPRFVHARSRDQLRIPSVVLKGETPVIYFYTPEARKVRVDVGFPTGLWTQWYPQAQIVGPHFTQMASAIKPAHGRIRWCAHIVPADGSNPPPEVPATGEDALWRYARDVDAAYVQTNDYTTDQERVESERFLFYRGLGEAPLPLRFSADAGGMLEATEGDPSGAKHVFVLRVENGKGTFLYKPSIKAGERLTNLIPSMDGARPLEVFEREIGEALEGRLVESGLYAKEARAMVNTWRTSYFETDGIRTLVILPQAWTDRFIPLTITPTPRETVRVMVGRLELLTSAREQKAEEAVHALASADSKAREAAFAFLRDQGRYVEPIVRRVRDTTTDEQVRTLCTRLLSAEFVTALRAAVHNAADGTRLQENPLHLRAQLAALLLEVGLKDEAKAEGQAVLEGMKHQPAPALSDSDSRQYLRALARAFEAAGDTQGAARWYGQFVRFSSQVATNQDCRFCHRDAGPTDLAFFRDWWAGRKFAALAIQTEGSDPAVARQQAALDRDPDDLAARLMLAYLLDARGESTQASSTWASILSTDPGPTLSSR